MASLLVLKGGTSGQRITLDKASIILGREAKDCDVVIPNQAVSRVHAQITLAQGRHFIEDLRSRNKTYVNNKLVDAKTPLNDNDRIKICDFLCTYHAESEKPTPVPLPKEMRADEEDQGADGPSTVQATLPHMKQHQLLDLQPADRLRAILEIASSLGETVQIDALLQKIADILLATFKQADRCFIILREESNNQLIPRVIKTRRPQPEGSARFSRTIVRNCLDSQKAFLSEDASTDSKFSLAQSITDFRILSVMCVPLVVAEKAAGVIQLDSQDRSKKFVQDDLTLLMAVANQAAIAIERSRLLDEQIQRERIQRDLELGEQVQRSFLPQRLPEVQGYQFFAQYKSALTIGGDYYDFMPLRGGKWAALLGDVAGKGVPAALLMAKLSAEARYCMLTNEDPAEAVSCLNDILLHAGTMDRFVTLAATVLDPSRNTVTVLNAGHMTPLIFRRHAWTLEEAIPNERCGLPLGIVEGSKFESAKVELQPGDTVMMYTDGVSDALSVDNRPFTLDGIRAAVLNETALAGGPYRPDYIGKRVLDAVRKHSTGRAQNDDIALVCFGRLGSMASVSNAGTDEHGATALAPESE
jgi:serine phosphatase RsbU (regulator of sigma subunit)